VKPKVFLDTSHVLATVFDDDQFHHEEESKLARSPWPDTSTPPPTSASKRSSAKKPITQQAPKGGIMRVADHVDTGYGKIAKPKPWDFRLDAVYCIAILGYEMNGSTKAVNRNSIRNDYPPHELFYPKLRYLTIELPLFDESKPEYGLDKHLNKWLYFLKYLPELDRIPEIFANEVVFKRRSSLRNWRIFRKKS